MTSIDFHTGVADPLDYTCKLLKKAWTAALTKQTTILVVGDAEWLGELDEMLWTFSATDFIPHDFLSDAEDARDVPPQVWLATPEALLDAASSLHHLLIHVGASPIDDIKGFERFDRFIEIVGKDEVAMQAGRARFKHYKERGYPLNHYAKN